MTDTILINPLAVEKDAENISGLSQFLEESPLHMADTRTTITANASGQEAYAASQKLLASFGKSMEKEVSNIRSVGAAFVEYDAMIASFMVNNHEYSKVKAVER